MAVLNIQTAPPTGQAAVTASTMSTQSTLPSIIYILTNDTFATITATGYLTGFKMEGFTFSNNQMALVYTTDDGPVWCKVVITYSGANILNTVVSLAQISSPGDVVLPTIANHIIVSTDTVGTLANLTGTAINNGTIQSGLLAGGVVGAFVAYPTTTLSGFLELLPVVNSSGNFNTIISNAAAIAQTQTLSIPDSGASAANFIVSKTTGTQHITVGALQVDAGVISSGLATGPTAGGFIAYPATTTTGSLRLTPVSNVGNFAASISNVVGLGQASVYTLPDPGNAIARLVVGATATPFVSGEFLVASGTGGLVVSSGFTAANVMRLDAVNTLTGIGQIILVKANGVESGNAVTASGNAGVITTSALTTAAGSTYSITWTNTKITATSVIGLTIQGGTNTVQSIQFTCAPGSGTATLVINNIGPTNALNGTIFIGYSVL